MMTIPEPPTIRPARADEASDLTALALRSKASWGYDAAFMERCTPVLAVDTGYERTRPVFVAEVGGEIAGFCSLRGTGPEVELDFLFVEPRLFGRGVGRALFERAREHARGAGHERMVVESDPFAEAFYLRLGGRTVRRVASTLEEGRTLPLVEFRLGAPAGVPGPPSPSGS